ncbi:MAG: ATP-binding protein [Acidobacteriota bacterium]
MNRKRTWLWWSSGKDSAWALHVLRKRPDVEVRALVTTVTAEFDRVAMHAVRTELLRRQASSVGIELRIISIPHPCSNSQYEAAVAELLKDATEESVACMAFGDLFLEDVREYREKLLSGTGIEPLFPLWGEDTSPLSHSMVSSGLRAFVTCVDPRRLSRDLVGREFDLSFLADLPDGADPCGEHGEFHTFAFAGPVFSWPVEASVGEVVERDGFVFADLQPASVPPHPR